MSAQTIADTVGTTDTAGTTEPTTQPIAQPTETATPPAPTLAPPSVSDIPQTEAERAVVLQRLGAPFPPEAVKSRRGGGGRTFSYVPGYVIIHRLNDVAPGWDFRVTGTEWRTIARKTRDGATEATMLVVTGELTIPGLGTRAGMGVQVLDDNGGEDLVKGATTDAMKKAATLFGVALELYGPDVEGDADDQPRQPAQRPASGPAQRPAPTPIRPTAEQERERSTAAWARITARARELDWPPHELREYAASKRQVDVEDMAPFDQWAPAHLERLAEYMDHFPAAPPARS